ncbi:MAG: UvrB/UvrC motif-containing protein, partial [Actinomycetota bacterium]
VVVERLRDRMEQLAAAQRYEEAAATRDRLSALLGAVRRTELMHRLVEAGEVEVSDGEVTWVIHQGRLIDTRAGGQLTAAIPVAPGEPLLPGAAVPRDAADELLVLARHLDRHSTRLQVTSTGPWRFPVDIDTTIEPIRRAA